MKGDSIAILEYHLGDAFENPDAEERIFYYYPQSIAFPTAIFDGTRELIGGDPQLINDYLSIYYEELLIGSPCKLNILVEYDSATRFLKVKSRVTALDTLSNAHLHYAIAESHIYHHWGSDYTLWLDSLHHVARKMLPDYNGVAFNIDSGQSFVDSQTCLLDSAWNDKNCFVVVFAQRDDRGDFNRPVLRSAKMGLFQSLSWVFGDANGDGIVNVGDVVYLMNYVFLLGSPPNPLASGDPNSDCIVDSVDILYLIYYLFLCGPEPLNGCAW